MFLIFLIIITLFILWRCFRWRVIAKMLTDMLKENGVSPTDISRDELKRRTDKALDDILFDKINNCRNS